MKKIIFPMYGDFWDTPSSDITCAHAHRSENKKITQSYYVSELFLSHVDCLISLI